MKHLFLILILLSGFIIRAQRSDETLKEYFLDAEFFFIQEEYMDALNDYMELYNNGFKNNANINYRIGICYLNIPGQKNKSIPFFLEAIKNIKNNNKDSEYKETKAPIDAYLYLGNAYRVNNMLDKAIEAYTKYKELLNTNDNEGISYANNEIEACKVAEEFMSNPLQVRKTNLGKPINNASSNYRAVLSGDGNTILYMNKLPFYDAVYYSRYENGAWTKPINITPQLQSEGNQYVTSLSYDGTVLYLSKEDNFNSDIYISYMKNGRWSESKPLSKKINSKFWESHVSISKDGKTLYLASNRKDAIGGMDIYKSTLDENGEWGTPKNLGSVINTKLNEDTPFITEDEKTLFFSSQGHHGIGGYDLYKSVLNENGEWGTPENLGYPLSTTDDDLFYYPWNNGKLAYMALIEPDGFGKEDIYEIQVVTPEIIEETITEKITEDVIEEEESQEEIPEEKIHGEEETIIAKELFLNPIYFDFDSYKLTEEGKKELDKIVLLLKEMNNLTIELIGYTDAIGAASYNKILSEKRSLSALNYILAKGIDAHRLKTIGLGETNFVAINRNPDGTDNPEGRKHNRRVEFEIKGVDENKVNIKRTPVPENIKIK